MVGEHTFQCLDGKPFKQCSSKCSKSIRSKWKCKWASQVQLECSSFSINLRRKTMISTFIRWRRQNWRMPSDDHFTDLSNLDVIRHNIKPKFNEIRMKHQTVVEAEKLMCSFDFWFVFFSLWLTSLITIIWKYSFLCCQRYFFSLFFLQFDSSTRAVWEALLRRQFTCLWLFCAETLKCASFFFHHFYK